jgi:hypothetical protein
MVAEMASDEAKAICTQPMFEPLALAPARDILT